MYYSNKIETLKDIFDTSDIQLESERLCNKKPLMNGSIIIWARQEVC